jgi:hypothetical protein
MTLMMLNDTPKLWMTDQSRLSSCLYPSSASNSASLLSGSALMCGRLGILRGYFFRLGDEAEGRETFANKAILQGSARGCG